MICFNINNNVTGSYFVVFTQFNLIYPTYTCSMASILFIEAWRNVACLLQVTNLQWMNQLYCSVQLCAVCVVEMFIILGLFSIIEGVRS